MYENPFLVEKCPKVDEKSGKKVQKRAVLGEKMIMSEILVGKPRKRVFLGAKMIVSELLGRNPEKGLFRSKK